jgi:hypothetical protein
VQLTNGNAYPQFILKIESMSVIINYPGLDLLIPPEAGKINKTNPSIFIFSV